MVKKGSGAVIFEQRDERRERRCEPHMYMNEERGQTANAKARALKLNI